MAGVTSTETIQNQDGSVTTTVTDKKTGVIEETTTYPTGVTIKTTTDAQGTITAVVDLQKEATAEVMIPVKDITPGKVAVIVYDDGTEQVLQNCIPVETGLAVTLTSNATLKIVDNAATFGDVSANSWYSAAVDFVSARGIMTGVGEETFAPAATTTRAMIWAMLARLDGTDTDGGDSWYQKGLEWAKDHEISDGSDPAAFVTREQLVTMLWRYAGSLAVTSEELTVLEQYADAGEISEYAQKALAWAISTNIIEGMENSTLQPGDTATRAQVATMLMRFCESTVQ